MSQPLLGKISGVSQTTISDIETGRNTSSKELPRLAVALKVSVEELLYGLKISSQNVIFQDGFSRLPLLAWEQILNGGRSDSFAVVPGCFSYGSFCTELAVPFMQGMRGDFIKEGAVITVEPTNSPKSGDIVFGVLDDLQAIGHYLQMGSKTILRPSNEQFGAIDATNGRLLGVVRHWSVGVGNGKSCP